MVQPEVRVQNQAIRAERIEKSSTSDQLWEKSSIWLQYSNTSPFPAEQENSNYRADTTHHSGERPNLRLELVFGFVWLTARSRRSWRMLKQLTLWPTSQWARSTASKVLCQEKYWFHVLLCVHHSNPHPSSGSDWKKFNLFSAVCFVLLLSRRQRRAWSGGSKMQIGQWRLPHTAAALGEEHIGASIAASSEPYRNSSGDLLRCSEMLLKALYISTLKQRVANKGPFPSSVRLRH